MPSSFSSVSASVLASGKSRVAHSGWHRADKCSLTRNKSNSTASGGSSGLNADGSSTTSGSSPSGTATGSAPKPTATTGGQGSVLTFEDGSTMTYDNPFGGKWVWDAANPFNVSLLSI